MLRIQAEENIQYASFTYLQEDHEEGRDKVVDSLNISGGGVSDGPDVEDPLHHLLHAALLE